MGLLSLFSKPRPTLQRLPSGSITVDRVLEDKWPIAANDHWYDLTLHGPGVQFQLAGHIDRAA